MKESFPERPPLFLDFVLPSGPEDLSSNLWIADPHTTTPTLHGLENLKRFRRSNPIRFCSQRYECCNQAITFVESGGPVELVLNIMEILRQLLVRSVV